MNKKALLIIILLSAIVTGGFVLRDRIYREYLSLSGRVAQIENPSIEMIRHSVEKEVFTPPPFRSKKNSPNPFLSVEGVRAETNRHRAENGLGGLTASSSLDEAARIKLDDMFNRQYFAHDSPTGEGPAEVANQAGYAYVIIGENLALGNFADDVELVQGWMDSPGHRANILHTGYTEIGVAVGRGVFEGKQTWLAVQEFGVPAASCPAPDESLERDINDQKDEITRLEAELDAKRSELEAYEPKQGEGYNRLVREYNNLVDRYNGYVRDTKELVDEYNRQAGEYNDCLKSITG